MGRQQGGGKTWGRPGEDLKSSGGGGVPGFRVRGTRVRTDSGTGSGVRDRVASGGCPPEAPTDPNVRN